MNRSLVEKRQVTATEEREIAKNIFVVAPGVWRLKDIFVNVFIVQNTDATSWVLVDAGLKSSATKIKEMAATLFGGRNSTPSAIVMTHGHFDHRGSLQQLATEWGVPVYCHHMELPYLTGKAAYPPADSSVGGGMMATLSFAYPKEPINVEDHLQELPDDNSVPELDDWQWIHTPGHTPGHISLFRERDGVLIAGDAIVTTKQESAISVMMQKKVVSGPPQYFTPDWGSSAASVKKLAALEPNVVATGHGRSMYGEEVRHPLHQLAKKFWQKAMPAQGRYVSEPALFNEEGPTYIPPARRDYTWLRIVGATAMVVVGYMLYKKKQKTLAKTLMAGSITMLTAPVPTI